jgi:putative PIN family toxin of toxin-antitoxin system
MKRESKSCRIIIDSNIWISFLIGKSLLGLQNHIDSQQLKIITCNEQLIELSEVFKKPKLKKYFTKEQISEFFELLDESSECIIISTKSDICRDPKDNYLVSLAIDSKANYLISGDKDLLDLNKIGDTVVLKYADFDKIIFTKNEEK